MRTNIPEWWGGKEYKQKDTLHIDSSEHWFHFASVRPYWDSTKRKGKNVKLGVLFWAEINNYVFCDII
jgi:hypothetical protein